MKIMMDWMTLEVPYNSCDYASEFWFISGLCKRILENGIQKSIEKLDSAHFAIAIEVVKEKLNYRDQMEDSYGNT